jgi:glycosyltransferase involved in cell wall biosynthesis
MIAKSNERLIVIPTYNEADNIDSLVERLVAANLDADILFVDDSSPDGTADRIAELTTTYPVLHVLKRPAKSGIGSAQRDGILLAYQMGYREVATMDADLTHSPSDLRRFLNCPEGDVVIGSRFHSHGGLPGWTLARRLLTHAGHLLTRFCLGISYDATGALRVYRINRIPRRVFELTQSNGYAFLFESLFLIASNGFNIRELPIVLPGRIVGSSKLRASDLLHSVSLLFQYLIIRVFLPERIRLVDLTGRGEIEKGSDEAAGWDKYWGCRLQLNQLMYDVLAGFYRRLVIRRPFERSIRTNFTIGARLLHAGCGTGQVDSRLLSQYRISAIDYSKRAIELYLATNGETADARIGSIFKIPFPDRHFQGVYNLGVMEHFSREQIVGALKEFHRVLVKNGRIVLWWPPEKGSSVIILKFISIVLKRALGRNFDSFFPDECSRLKSRDELEEMLQEAGFTLETFRLSLEDLFTQVLVIARKCG